MRDPKRWADWARWSGTALSWCLTAAVMAVLGGGYRIQVMGSDKLAPQVPNGSLVVFRHASIDQIHKGDVIVFVGPSRSPGMAVQRVVESVGVGLKAQAYTANGPEPDNFFAVSNERLRGKAALVIPRSAFIGRALAHRWATPLLSACTVAFWLAGFIWERLKHRAQPETR